MVLLHCNGLAHSFSNTAAWYQAMAVETLFYWPVPVFFMLSGATLMDYRSRYTTAEFLKRRFLRTGVPFVAWSVISALVLQLDIGAMGLQGFISRLLNTSLLNVYWFFIPLFGAYLAMPVLSLLKDNRRILWYITAVAFVLTSLLPYVCQRLGITWNAGLNLPVAGGYLLYVILGYLLASQPLTRRQRIGVYIAGGIGVVVRFAATVAGSLQQGSLYRGYFNYLGYFSVFLAAAVFVAFANSRRAERLGENPRAAGWIKALSGCSFGVFLIHMLLCYWLGKLMPTNTWLWRLGMPVVIYALSAGITWVLKKIPGVKWLLP